MTTERATTVTRTADLAELRRAVALLIPTLDWRCNGLGVLQAYIFEGPVEETRVHVWHPSIEKDGIVDSGKLHDHRFTLRSTVLCGDLVHTEFQLSPHAEGNWQAFPVVHARKAMKAEKTFDGTVTADPQRYFARTQDYRLSAGDTYLFKKRHFHGTYVDGLVVTLVSKLDQEDVSARILAPAGSTPVHAFADPLPRDRWAHLLVDAVSALRATEQPEGASWRGACGCVVISTLLPSNPCTECGGDFYGIGVQVTP